MSTNKSLLELTGEYQRIMHLLMEAGGELTPEIEQELTVHQELLAAKADRYDFILQHLESEEAHWKAQADRFARVARVCSAARERLRASIKGAMQQMGVTEITGESVAFKLTNNAPKLVLNETALDKEYVVETIVREPNKDKIKGALKEGKEVIGAHFEPVVALRVSVARKVK